MKTFNTLMMSGIVALGAVATGCQSTSDMTETNTKTNSTITTYQITDRALQANDWQLVDAKKTNGNNINILFADSDKPLTISFNTVDDTKVMNLRNTCNTISAPYTVENGQVKLGSFMSTMMACPDEEAKFDSAAVASVVGKYTLSAGDNNTPMLVVTNDNQVAHFKAVAKTPSN